MGQDSKIEWTTHTFNPWWGCEKVSPACKHCYAESFSRSKGGKLWGKDAPRRFFGDKHWAEPLKWDRKAVDRVYEYTLEERQHTEHLRTRPRVFCASMADVFEDRDDLVAERARLFKLIDSTPWLDWLLLTKRPENICRLWPAHDEWQVDRDHETNEAYKIHVLGRDCDGLEGSCCWGSGWLPDAPYPLPSEGYRQNVWLGTTVENQEYADLRIPHLIETTYLAPVNFLSMEPLLGPVDFRKVPLFNRVGFDLSRWWVIVGGESGPGARPMHPDWARSIQRQCNAAAVPFFFKQWGEWVPRDHVPVGTTWRKNAFLREDGSHAPSVEFVKPQEVPFEVMSRVGKKVAGRMLDGQAWDQVPTPFAWEAT